MQVDDPPDLHAVLRVLIKWASETPAAALDLERLYEDRVAVLQKRGTKPASRWFFIEGAYLALVGCRRRWHLIASITRMLGWN